jgi:hypothetical protein
MKNTYNYISEYETIVNVMNHPAFESFGSYVFPWDERNYGANIRMNQISLLMPYHTRVDTGIAVRSLNRMIDDINAGETVFYRFYTEEEREDPPKKNTGFFLPW